MVVLEKYSTAHHQLVPSLNHVVGEETRLSYGRVDFPLQLKNVIYHHYMATVVSHTYIFSES